MTVQGLALNLCPCTA